MELLASLLFAALIGFGHAFEADHLLAVSNLVTQRQNPRMAVKDGIYWGLGHSSTIFLVGLIMIVGKSTLLNGHFHQFEALVGGVLIALGVHRLYRWQHQVAPRPGRSQYQLAYGVGLIHGLAGSGTMVLLVMSEMEGVVPSLLYLLVFGIGSVGGMLTAAGVFSLPFAQDFARRRADWRAGLVLLSSLLCIGYGAWIIFKNLA
ncbi:MAG: urease accessory protein [Tunicatimonas sp.]